MNEEKKKHVTETKLNKEIQRNVNDTHKLIAKNFCYIFLSKEYQIILIY